MNTYITTDNFFHTDMLDKTFADTGKKATKGPNHGWPSYIGYSSIHRTLGLSTTTRPNFGDHPENRTLPDGRVAFISHPYHLGKEDTDQLHLLKDSGWYVYLDCRSGYNDGTLRVVAVEPMRSLHALGDKSAFVYETCNGQEMGHLKDHITSYYPWEHTAHKVLETIFMEESFYVSEGDTLYMDRFKNQQGLTRVTLKDLSRAAVDAALLFLNATEFDPEEGEEFVAYLDEIYTELMSYAEHPKRLKQWVISSPSTQPASDFEPAIW